MTVEQFLDQLGAEGLLTAKQLTRLRSQVEKSAKPVTPKALAKHLIDSGLLTLSQAQQLLAASSTETKSLPQQPTTAAKSAQPEVEDFGLAPLDEEVGLEPTPAAAKPKPTKTRPSVPANKSSEAVIPEPSSLLEELVDLEAAGPLDGGGLLDLGSENSILAGQGDPLLPPPAKKKSIGERFGSAEPKKYKKGANEWESPLILLGGGALLLMIIVGVAVFFLYSRGSGDDMFRLAEEDYKAGSYTQAIGKYGQYLERFPTHPSVSLAKVHLGLARLRQATEHTTDYGHSLEVAEAVAHEIENEKEFPDARSEFRALFPDIAEGIAKEAGQEKDPEKIKAKLELVQRALNLLSNPKYVLESQRPTQRINEIREMVTVAQRDLDRDAQLAMTVEAMQKSAESGEIAGAYSARKQLLKSYPDLLANETLAAAVLAVTKEERGAVKATPWETNAIAKEADSSLVSQVAFAVNEGSPAESGHTVVVLVDGAAYALDTGSGKLLWRRYLGANPSQLPFSIDPATDEADVLLVDAIRNELLRATRDSGTLVWRLPIAGRISGTAVGGKQAFVTTREGHLVAVDLKSGAAKSAVKFPQGLRLAPSIHEKLPKLYQVGDQSSIYLLGTGDLACQQAFYLGHESGTVRVPPIVLPRHLIVADNHGARSCTLHVLALADDGSLTKEVQRIELVGNVHTTPVLADRKLVVMTDAGHIKVLGVNASNLDQPLTDLADQPAAANSKTLVRYLFLEGGNLWIADKQLVRYKVQSAAGRLLPSALDDNYENAAFDHPLIPLGNSLVHVRRPIGSPGALVTASDLQDGHKFWETQIAAPAAGEPMVEGSSLALVTALGQLFTTTTTDRKQPALNEPMKPSASAAMPHVLTSRLDLLGGRFAFASIGETSVCVAQGTDGRFALSWLTLADGLACPPARLGKGLIAPTRIGQVFWLDPVRGKQVAAPFQPRLSAGETIPWTTPDTTADGKELVIADGQRHVYRLGVQKEPSPHLEPLATSDDLSQPLVTPIAVLESTAVAADAGGNLKVFKLPALDLSATVDLGGSVAWGPRRIGKYILLTTANDELLCLDVNVKIIWRHSLEGGPLAGTPALADGQLIVSTIGGFLVRLAMVSGQPLDSVNVNQPFATGPVALGSHWALAARDGTLLVVKLASGETPTVKSATDDTESEQ